MTILLGARVGTRDSRVRVHTQESDWQRGWREPAGGCFWAGQMEGWPAPFGGMGRSTERRDRRIPVSD